MNIAVVAERVQEGRSATERLAGTVGRLQAEDLTAASLLPGWTRAHVLTHIARNGDGARNMLLSVRSGRPVRMYASPATREADIEVGISRPTEVILADAVESSWRFVIDAECMPENRWAAEIPFSSGGTDPASLIAGLRPVEMRLREIEFHHVDLDAGYSFADSPEDLVEWLLADTIARLGRQGVSVDAPAGQGQPEWMVQAGGAECRVRGSVREMLAWLSGRSRGDGLAASGPLPSLPSLG